MNLCSELDSPTKNLLQNGLAEADGTLEVGKHHRFQFLHHAQPALQFRHCPEEFGDVPVSKPVGNEVTGLPGVLERGDVGRTDAVLALLGEDSDRRPLDFGYGFLRVHTGLVR